MDGDFAPVRREVTAERLVVEGSLPRELSGLYVRNGSNPAAGASPHWFLGDGMVHGVLLERGRALWYRNRWVRTPLYIERRGFGSGAPGGATSQSNVSVVHHAGRLLSLGEVGFPYELSTRDLSTIAPYDFAGRLTTSMTAHPKIDPETGTMHFFGYGFTPPYLTYHVADANGTLVSSQPVDVRGATMIHDFAITDRDVVFWELPVVFDMDAAVRAVQGGGISAGSFPFSWQPSYGARVGVMPLGGPASAIRWVEIDPCYVFHGVNAHRDGDRVVLDVCRLPSVFGRRSERRAEEAVALHRWSIDTSGGRLRFSDTRVSSRQAELPTIDKRYTGRRNRHAWFVEVRENEPTEFGGVVHHDLQTGRRVRWDPGPRRGSGEWLFVPGGRGEGEGWVLTYVWDEDRRASELVVLDAGRVADGPIARVALPQRVPFGFHATWVPADAL